MWLSHHYAIQRDRRGNARIWSDNLQLPYTSKLEVIWDQTTSNFLVYNLQHPWITSNFLMITMVVLVAMIAMVANNMLWLLVLLQNVNNNLYTIHVQSDYISKMNSILGSWWSWWSWRSWLANCPAAFLLYFHCGFVMKYSRRWEPSIRLSKMFEPFLWLEMTNLRAVFG